MSALLASVRVCEVAPKYPYYPLKRKLWSTVEQREGPMCFNCKVNEGQCLHELYGHRPFSYYLKHPEELKIACIPCNTSLKHKSKSASVSVSSARGVGGFAVDDDRKSAEMLEGEDKEPDWRAWVINRALFGPSVNVHQAVFGGAEKFSLYGVAPEDRDPLSPVTTRRWLKKLVSDEGPCKLGFGRKGYEPIEYRARIDDDGSHNGSLRVKAE